LPRKEAQFAMKLRIVTDGDLYLVQYRLFFVWWTEETKGPLPISVAFETYGGAAEYIRKQYGESAEIVRVLSPAHEAIETSRELHWDLLRVHSDHLKSLDRQIANVDVFTSRLQKELTIHKESHSPASKSKPAKKGGRK
jgi:hypothetical protein